MTQGGPSGLPTPTPCVHTPKRSHTRALTHTGVTTRYFSKMRASTLVPLGEGWALINEGMLIEGQGHLLVKLTSPLGGTRMMFPLSTGHPLLEGRIANAVNMIHATTGAPKALIVNGIDESGIPG
jgi:hypothetical protein